MALDPASFSDALSVIIAARSCAEPLLTCLKALSCQEALPGGFEVVLVLPVSPAADSERLAQLFPALSLRFGLLDNWKQPEAFNRGAELATGKFCLFLSEHSAPAPRLVAEHLRAQRRDTGCVGIGQTLLETSDSDWLTALYAEEQAQLYTALARNAAAPVWAWRCLDNLSVPRPAFLAAGGFAFAFAQQFCLELAYRLEQDGLAILFLPEAQTKQIASQTFYPVAAAVEEQGSTCVKLYDRHASKLPRLFEAYGAATPRAFLLRQILLSAGLAPGLLVRLVAALVRHPKRRTDWYGFIRSYCFWRGVRRGAADRDMWRRLTSGTPILTYHAFARPGESASRYVMAPSQFKTQMAWLKWRRYEILSLENFLKYRLEFRLPPPRSVVITIDDGYADNYTVAYPILRRFHFPATVFLVSQRLGGVNDWDTAGQLAGRPLLTGDQAREMLEGGIAFGSHTRTHADVSALSPSQAREEIFGSRAELEQALHAPIRTFSYPHGRLDEISNALVAQAGYWGACNTQRGSNYPATSATALRRNNIRGTGSFLSFVYALQWGNANHG